MRGCAAAEPKPGLTVRERNFSFPENGCRRRTGAKVAFLRRSYSTRSCVSRAPLPTGIGVNRSPGPNSYIRTNGASKSGLIDSVGWCVTVCVPPSMVHTCQSMLHSR